MAAASSSTQSSALTEALDRLSPEKRRLVEQRLRAKAGRPDIGRRPDGTPRRVSAAQLALLLLDAATEDLNAYNVAQAMRIRGSLDVPALIAALDALVARHEVLRSRYSLRNGQGHVEVGEPGPCDVKVTKISDVDAFVHGVVGEPFGLDEGRLLRARIGVVSADDHVLVLSTHHIASDAVSKQVLGRELNELYVAQRDGRRADLPEITFDYADFAFWQERRAESQSDLQWWRSTLTGAPEQAGVPVDRPRPARPSFAGAKHGRLLDADLFQRVQHYAAEHHATTFMVLLAAFTALLERYSGQGDFVVGSPTSGRHHDEFADVVGLFITMLPLRVDASGDPTFDDLLTRVRDVAAESYRHQDVSFEQIVDAVHPVRVPGQNPIFQTMFTLKAGADGAQHLDGLDVTLLPYEGGWTKFDLSVICYPSGGGLAVTWQYATALYDAGTIERLARHFERVLRAVMDRPTTRLSALPLADAADVDAVETWNATDVETPGGLVHELISEQARRTPDAEAVGDSVARLTFRELDERSNRLARRLAADGVGPGDHVAIFLERSVELEIALLGVLKAGAAYVPLDTGYPHDRLDFMLRDCAASALITSSGQRDRAPDHERVLQIDTLDLVTGDASPPAVAMDDSALAYVLYTSGTTGRPKGVQIEHRNVVNQLHWMQRELRIDGSDVVLQKTPISFDVAGWEVLLAPLCGARLFMARPDGHLDPDYLIDTIRSEQVTVVNFVPSMLAVFLARDDAARCSSLRLVISCGEALPDDVKESCLHRLPRTQLWNLYGPTETAIGITYEQCGPQDVTIGRPMANCHAYVLDDDRNHQPVGMAGELYLGGVQLARGYLGRPELTAERFVDTVHGRLYRTGDRAVWRDDGRLQYLARLDDQVKLHGFRIELGEIETVLAGHDEVSAACATVATTTTGEKSLVAFVTLREPGTVYDVPLEQVDEWQSVWEEVYRDEQRVDRSFDTRGWISSFTGRRVGESDMREWVNTTVDRIAELQPARVLEVGVGSGLLLWRLAPRVEQYDGTDVSPAAVRRLQASSSIHPNSVLQVQPAHELRAVTPGTRYDCVVLNSVVQYFPDADYLRAVLERAVGVLAPGGSVFVGDVRDLRLLDAFAGEMAEAHSVASSPAELAAQAAERRALEPELLLDPAFFRDIPGVTHVRVQPRRGHADTEMNRFRYDVTLLTGAVAAEPVDDWLDWSELGSVDALSATLRDRQPGTFGVSSIPNARVAGTLRRTAARHSGDASRVASVTDVEALHTAAAVNGYRVELSVARSPGTLDAVFTRRHAPAQFPPAPTPPTVANDPRLARARVRQRAAVIRELDERATATLPPYMKPSTIRVLQSMPTTPAGKLDRRAAGSMTGYVRVVAHAAPATETERRLAHLWQDALGIDTTVSRDDSFFDLGGSSLLALRLFPKLERQFRTKLSLSMLFENVTIASLGAVIDAERGREQSWDLVVPMRRTGHKKPLFLMPTQRGDVLPYRQVVNALGQDRPVYGIECSGLDGRRQPRTTIEEIANDTIDAMRDVQPEGPYVIAGYCFGGVVAFEVAAQLVSAGEQVDFLGVIDATPFGRGGSLMPRPSTSTARRFVWRTRAELQVKVGWVLREVRRRLRIRVNDAAASLARRVGRPIPPRFVNVHEANRRAGRAYVAPDAPVEVIFFRASAGEAVADELRRQRWELVAGKGVQMHLVAGHQMNHAQIIAGGYASRLATVLDDCLADLP